MDTYFNLQLELNHGIDEAADPSYEIAVQLRKIADQIDRGRGAEGRPVRVLDANGNHCGLWTLVYVDLGGAGEATLDTEGE